MSPQLVTMLQNLALISSSMAKTEESSQFYKEVLSAPAVRGDNGEFILVNATISLMLGDITKAVEFCDSALSIREKAYAWAEKSVSKTTLSYDRQLDLAVALDEPGEIVRTFHALDVAALGDLEVADRLDAIEPVGGLAVVEPHVEAVVALLRDGRVARHHEGGIVPRVALGPVALFQHDHRDPVVLHLQVLLHALTRLRRSR